MTAETVRTWLTLAVWLGALAGALLAIGKTLET